MCGRSGSLLRCVLCASRPLPVLLFNHFGLIPFIHIIFSSFSFSFHCIMSRGRWFSSYYYYCSLKTRMQMKRCININSHLVYFFVFIFIFFWSQSTMAHIHRMAHNFVEFIFINIINCDLMIITWSATWRSGMEIDTAICSNWVVVLRHRRTSKWKMRQICAK